MNFIDAARHKAFWLVAALVLVAGLVFVIFSNRTGTADFALNGTVVQTIGNVRIREQPNVSADRLGALDWGQSARITGVDSSGLWYRVEADGLEGWAAADSFIIADAAPAQVDAASVNSPTGVVVRALDNAGVRPDPSLQSERLSVIPWGGYAALLAVSEGGQWYQIEYDGVVGWSAADWLQVETG